MEKQTNAIETIIYGGAFHPPTRAHQAILQECIALAAPQNGEVWLLPSADRQDKTIGARRERRLALCAALLHDVAANGVPLRIDTTELDREKPTETFDTVQEFSQYYPGRHFRWVFGADSVATMPEWHGGEWMQRELDMLIVARKGVTVPALGRNTLTLAVATGDESSTELRRRIAANEPYEQLVGPAVYQELLGATAR